MILMKLYGFETMVLAKVQMISDRTKKGIKVVEMENPVGLSDISSAEEILMLKHNAETDTVVIVTNARIKLVSSDFSQIFFHE